MMDVRVNFSIIFLIFLAKKSIGKILGNRECKTLICCFSLHISFKISFVRCLAYSTLFPNDFTQPEILKLLSVNDNAHVCVCALTIISHTIAYIKNYAENV